jgi:CheY-like chemotaxis protein
MGEGSAERVFEILLVEDAPAMADLMSAAFGEISLSYNAAVFRDATEALEYLKGFQRHSSTQERFSLGRFSTYRSAMQSSMGARPPSESGPALPDLIVIRLNLPTGSGRELLTEIKDDPFLKPIPVIVFTNSDQEEGLTRAYDLGANSCILKPSTAEEIVDVMKSVGEYWFKMVELPSR